MSMATKLRDSALALADAATTVIGAIVSYRIVARHLGVDTFGLWALVSAALFPLRFADLAINSAVMRYIGVARGAGMRSLLLRLVAMALSINLVAFGVFLAGALAVSPGIIHRTVGAAQWQAAFALIPYLVAAGLMQLVAGVFSAAVLGLMRFRAYYIVGIFSSAIQVGMIFPLIERFGIAGYALVQVATSVFQTICYAIVLIRQRDETDVPERAEFAPRAFIAFAFKLNLNTLLVILIEPLAKLLLGRFGTLSNVGVYEVSIRVLTQLRAIVVAPLQPLAVSMIKLRDRDRAAFGQTYRLTFAYCTAAALAYAIGTVPFWFAVRTLVPSGDVSLLTVAVAAISTAATLVAVPAYNASIAGNDVRPILASTILYLVVTAGFGFALGPLLGAPGVLFAILGGYVVGNAAMLALCRRLLDLETVPRPSELWEEGAAAWRAVMARNLRGGA